MNTNTKDLLIKDLCARLPYGVKARGFFVHYNKDKDKIQYEECDKKVSWQDLKRYKTLKPYIRPMSSMTEEEMKELTVAYDIDYIDAKYVDFGEFLCEGSPVNIKNINGLLDWLNAHYFDYRGLIEKGLALIAPDGMYK